MFKLRVSVFPLADHLPGHSRKHVLNLFPVIWIILYWYHMIKYHKLTEFLHQDVCYMIIKSRIKKVELVIINAI